MVTCIEDGIIREARGEVVAHAASLALKNSVEAISCSVT